MRRRSGKRYVDAAARAAALITGLSLAASAVGAHPSARERIGHLDAAIEAAPGDPANYLRRGRIELDEGHFEQAREDFAKAASLGDPIVVAFDQGILAHRMGDLAAARRALDTYLVRFPDDARALEARARVHRDANEVKAALADFEAAFARQARPNPGDYVAAAEMLAGASPETGGVERALALLDAGMARLGTIPQLERPAIALERRRGREDQALARLDRLEPILGRSPDWKVDRAESLLRLGRLDEARAQLDAADRQLERLSPTGARAKLRDRLARLVRQVEEAEKTPKSGSSD